MEQGYLCGVYDQPRKPAKRTTAAPANTCASMSQGRQGWDEQSQNQAHQSIVLALQELPRSQRLGAGGQVLQRGWGSAAAPGPSHADLCWLACTHAGHVGQAWNPPPDAAFLPGGSSGRVRCKGLQRLPLTPRAQEHSQLGSGRAESASTPGWQAAMFWLLTHHLLCCPCTTAPCPPATLQHKQDTQLAHLSGHLNTHTTQSCTGDDYIQPSAHSHLSAV